MAFRTSARCKERKYAIEDEKIQLENAISAIRTGKDPPGFEINYIDENIGYGVFATRDFHEGEFLVEYSGESISRKEAKAREKLYGKTKRGSFMYFIKYHGKVVCVDATNEQNTGRMINDAAPGSVPQNARLKIIDVDCKPHICLFAMRVIKKNEEIRYDYGVDNLPWRKMKKNIGDTTRKEKKIIIFGDNVNNTEINKLSKIAEKTEMEEQGDMTTDKAGNDDNGDMSENETNTDSDKNGNEVNVDDCTTSVDVDNDVERISDEYRATDTESKTSAQESGELHTTNTEVKNDVERILKYLYRAAETNTVSERSSDEESEDEYAISVDMDSEVERISHKCRAADTNTNIVSERSGVEESEEEHTISDDDTEVIKITDENRAADKDTNIVCDGSCVEESEEECTISDDVDREVEQIIDEYRAAEIKTFQGTNGDEESGDGYITKTDEIEKDIESISDERRAADTETNIVSERSGVEESEEGYTITDDVDREVIQITDEYRAADNETNTVSERSSDEESEDEYAISVDMDSEVERISHKCRAADTNTNIVSERSGVEESEEEHTISDDDTEVIKITDENRAADKDTNIVCDGSGVEESEEECTISDDVDREVEQIIDEYRAAEIKTFQGTNGDEESGDGYITKTDEIEKDIESISDERRAADTETNIVSERSGVEESEEGYTITDDVDREVIQITDEYRAADNDEQFWGSVVVIKNGVPFGVYPMCSTMLAIGSATSNDVIVKKAARREIMLEVNRSGEVFSINSVTKEVKHVEDKELFRVAGKEFQWFYPVREETKTNGTNGGEESEVEKYTTNTEFERISAESGAALCTELDSVPCTNGDEESGAEYSTDTDDVEKDVQIFSDESRAADTELDSVPCTNGDEESGAEYSTDTDDAEKDVQIFSDESRAADTEPESQTDTEEHEHIVTFENIHTARVPVVESEQADDICISRHAVTAYRRQMANVTIPIYSKKANGKRDYRKINACLYCGRLFTSKIAPHYENMHTDKDAVQKVRLMVPDSKQRDNALLELEHRGNFQHNAKVIEKGTGELIVARRPNKAYKDKYGADDFIPCEFCLAFYLKTSLWQHVRTCPFKPSNEQPSANYINNGLTIVSPFVPKLPEEEVVLEKLFLGMKETAANPGIPYICESDPLIREFGRSLLGRLGEDDEQRIKDVDNVRTKVRTVGRLLKELRNVEGGEKTLSDFITGTGFKKVVSATKSLALHCDSPQLALTLGHYVKQISFLKVSCGIMTGSNEMQKEGKNFQYLYEAHWNNQVSCVAKRRQRLRQMNKISKIPSTSDLITLNTWIQQELTRVIKIDSPSIQEWKWAAELSMARVILFNKRRVGEVMEIKVTDFNRLQQQSRDDSDDDIYRSLDISEQALAKRLRVLEVRGKSTRLIRKVYVILTPDMYNALEYLIRKRKHTSPFLFGRKSDLTPLDGCGAMRSVANKCPGLKEPTLIRTTLLRKYLATTSQILDMTNAELKLVADHMGHNVNIHTDIYRLQSSVLEKTKVARVLIALENGQINRFHGRNLDSISVDDLPQPITYDDSWTIGSSNDEQVPNPDTDDDSESELPMTREGNHDDARKRRSTDIETEEGNHGDARKRRSTDIETEEDIQFDSNKRRNADIETAEGNHSDARKRRFTDIETEEDIQCDSNKRRNADIETAEGNHGDARKRRSTDIETEEDIQCDSNKRRNADIETAEGARYMPKIKRVRWTETESKLFMEAFRTYVAQRKMPPSQAIHDISKKLQERTIAQIRTRIHNIISGKLKKF